MDIYAEDLYKRSNLRVIDETIEDIWRSIVNKVHDANSNGISEIEYELPEIFSLGNLEPKDSQIIVYADLLERLDERNLKTTLIPMRGGSAKLLIKWPSIMDPKEKERRMNIIKKHLKDN